MLLNFVAMYVEQRLTKKNLFLLIAKYAKSNLGTLIIIEVEIEDSIVLLNVLVNLEKVCHLGTREYILVLSQSLPLKRE